MSKSPRVAAAKGQMPRGRPRIAPEGQTGRDVRKAEGAREVRAWLSVAEQAALAAIRVEIGETTDAGTIRWLIAERAAEK